MLAVALRLNLRMSPGMPLQCLGGAPAVDATRPAAQGACLRHLPLMWFCLLAGSCVDIVFMIVLWILALRLPGLATWVFTSAVYDCMFIVITSLVGRVGIRALDHLVREIGQPTADPLRVGIRPRAACLHPFGHA